MGLAVIIISAMVIVTLVGQIGVKQFAKQDVLANHQSMVEAVVMTFALFAAGEEMKKPFVAALIAWVMLLAANPCSAATSESALDQRLGDARRLRKDSQHLQRQIDAINKSARSLKSRGTVSGASNKDSQPPAVDVATAYDANRNSFKLEAEEGKQQKPPDYQQLLQQYKAALSLYMAHREEIEKHVAAYHTQDQESQPGGQSESQSGSQPQAAAPLWPINVPRFKRLQAQVDDACVAMKNSEDELYESELACFSVIQNLIDNRKIASPSQYLSLWDTAENQAIQVQQLASVFNNQYIAKQRAGNEFISAKVSNAMRDGDYVESRDVYGQEQRQVELMHAELKRASAYSRTAVEFLMELNALSPTNPQKQTVEAARAAPSSAGVISDAQLEREFQEVQELYRKVQNAKPK